MPESAKNMIPASDAERLIAAHDGDVALLYIWLADKPVCDPDKAASELCRTRAEISAAVEKLDRMGLCRDKLGRRERKVSRPEPDAAEELPEYNAEDIARRSTEDMTFKAILSETKRILNKTSLTRPDMNILFGIYDYLAMPPEIILMLINYCSDLYAEKYGSERKLSMRAIEQEAYSWTRKEIFTIEQAEDYIKRSKDRRTEINLIKSELGIKGRNLSETERKYLSSWLEMGFGRDELMIAYDRTVTNTSGLKWGYMDKIVRSWHEKGLHSAKEIEEKDPRSGARSRAEKPASAVSKEEFERLQAVYDRVKNG